jgi:hypothetical protein
MASALKTENSAVADAKSLFSLIYPERSRWAGMTGLVRITAQWYKLNERLLHVLAT